jgi:hypothetical protein
MNFMKMQFSMFIDDERFPPDAWPSAHPLLLARSSEDSIYLMQRHGCPAFISFDHDLGGEDTAMKVVNWMINQDMDIRHYGLLFIPTDFSFVVHSQNPVGAKNITELLNRYLAFRNSEDGNLCV